MKSLLKQLFPRVYGYVWEWKNDVRTTLFGDWWSHYYTGEGLREPEDILTELTLPPHITRMLDVGCASGRNFIPFNGKLLLWGVDIVPKERIQWVAPFLNLTYQDCTAQELTRQIEASDIDLSDTFVFTAGTLMYLSKREQQRFFAACRAKGCTLFLFSEPTPASQKHPKNHFKLDPKQFTVLPNPNYRGGARYLFGFK